MAPRPPPRRLRPRPPGGGPRAASRPRGLGPQARPPGVVVRLGLGGALRLPLRLLQAYAPPSYRILGLPGSLFGAFHAAHLALTDLRTGERRFLESPTRTSSPRGGGRRRDLGWSLRVGASSGRGRGSASRPPGWTSSFCPLSPPVVHPPGYSGTEETGRMYYQSYTRAGTFGQVLGEGVQGESWLDTSGGSSFPGSRPPGTGSASTSPTARSSWPTR